MREETCVANGLRFALLEAGPADGTLALCLHGFPDTAWTWRHLLPALGTAGYRAVAPFLRGYAPTEAPAPGGYTNAELGRDACALHEALGGGRPGVLIGHDWGALAAYRAAAQAPERWRCLVTASVPPTGPIPVDLFSHEQMRRSWYSYLLQLPVAERLVAADDFRFLERLWADWSPGYDGAEDLVRVKEALRAPASLAAAIAYYRDNPSALPEAPAESAPAALPPLLYLHGLADGCIGADVVDAARPFFPPGAEVAVLEGAGHFLHLERPAEVNERILAFLDRVLAPL